MAHLAIKGHATRGKEVIEILEMLGGINKYNLRGDTDEWFVLNGTKIQRSDWLFAERGFTLEEFIEKFPYKVGDEVIVKGYKQVFKIRSMRWCSERNDVLHSVSNEWFYTEELQPYKEETMENKLGQITLDIPDGYEFFGINDDNKVVLTKIQPKYPKTYKECCDVLGLSTMDNDAKGYKVDLIIRFQELLIARDAYWKIAGDWKPDWNDNSKFKYTITCNRCNIIMYSYSTLNCILAFPTAEIRDVFYGNFKEMIEECKEFL